MSEGPISFGKPLFILVVVGCAGAGFYAYTHWPSVYEVKDGGSSWSVSWPHEWDTHPAQDPSNSSRVNSMGQLTDEIAGAGWAMTVPHGTLEWPRMVLANIGATAFKVDENASVDNKKSIIYEYEGENAMQYIGCAVDRGDVLVYVNIGCTKAKFEEVRPILEKVIKSVKCAR